MHYTYQIHANCWNGHDQAESQIKDEGVTQEVESRAEESGRIGRAC